MEITLGGVKLRLIYLGPTHSDNLIQIHIPQDKVLIAIDSAKGKSLFPDYRDMDVNNQLRALKILQNLDDVDIVLPGHGEVTDQQSFRDQYRYIKALRDEVLRHLVANRSLSEIKVLTAEYLSQNFGDYGRLSTWMESNIVTMYDYLYRYREPNVPISPEKAVQCIEDSRSCAD